MILTDAEFREQYKPLHVPSNYQIDYTDQDKIVFALAQLGEGTVTDVIGELDKLEPGFLNASMIATIKQVLTHFYDMGLIGGTERKGQRYYNLAKITHANGGGVSNGNLQASH